MPNLIYPVSIEIPLFTQIVNDTFLSSGGTSTGEPVCLSVCLSVFCLCVCVLSVLQKKIEKSQRNLYLT